MKESPWTVLHWDDDESITRQVKEFLEQETLSDGISFEVLSLMDFDGAIAALARQRFDIVILDVRADGNERTSNAALGIDVFQEVRKTRYVPIVFYTAVPEDVKTLSSPLVYVVEKTRTVQSLLEAVTALIDTGLPALNRRLHAHLDSVHRDYMWEFVAQHWADFGEPDTTVNLDFLLSRRLGLAFSELAIHRLDGDTDEPHSFRPIQHYIIPPYGQTLRAGDIIHGEIKNQTRFWITLTPSCDFAQSKVDHVLLAKCFLLEDQSEFQSWVKEKELSSNGTKQTFRKLLTNNRSSQPERYYFLPGVFNLPSLVVDLQALETIDCLELDTSLDESNKKLSRIATLDSPYGEALVNRFSRYFGRVGTPDLDVSWFVSQWGS